MAARPGDGAVLLLFPEILRQKKVAKATRLFKTRGKPKRNTEKGKKH